MPKILTISKTELKITKQGENEIWLEGAEVSRETYAQLFEIYGTTYGEGDGESTFNLPDFRNRTLWGADSFGYIEAGLPNIYGGISAIFHGNSAMDGALRITSSLNKSGIANGSGSGYDTLSFNAYYSNSIYGSSTTVQPPSVKVRVKTRFA